MEPNRNCSLATATAEDSSIRRKFVANCPLLRIALWKEEVSPEKWFLCSARQQFLSMIIVFYRGDQLTAKLTSGSQSEIIHDSQWKTTRHIKCSTFSSCEPLPENRQKRPFLLHQTILMKTRFQFPVTLAFEKDFSVTPSSMLYFSRFNGCCWLFDLIFRVAGIYRELGTWQNFIRPPRKRNLKATQFRITASTCRTQNKSGCNLV